MSACHSLERARTLGDPAVAPHVIAQQVCANCHGLDGNAVSPAFPKLAGQQAGYLADQLKAFQDGRRFDPAAVSYMWGMSARLSDAQIRGLADYYAAQAPRSPAGRPSSGLAKGRAIYEDGIAAKGVPPCARCHGPAAQGIANIPRLAGQHADYLMKQLLVYQRTTQRPDGSVMKEAVQALTDTDLRHVARYLEALSVPAKPAGEPSPPGR